MDTHLARVTSDGLTCECGVSWTGVTWQEAKRRWWEHATYLKPRTSCDHAELLSRDWSQAIGYHNSLLYECHCGAALHVLFGEHLSDIPLTATVGELFTHLGVGLPLPSLHLKEPAK